jgi:hypothetical protein
MGNSEVGHNAIGCGRVYSQGAMLVSNSIATGAMFEGGTWKKLVGNVKKPGAGSGRDHPLHRPLLRRQRAFAHRPPQGHGLALRRRGRQEGPRPYPPRRPRRGRAERPRVRRALRGLLGVVQREGLRLPHRLGRRAPVHHDGPLRRELGAGASAAGTATSSARAGSSRAPRPRSRPIAPSSPTSSTRTSTSS